MSDVMNLNWELGGPGLVVFLIVTLCVIILCRLSAEERKLQRKWAAERAQEQSIRELREAAERAEKQAREDEDRRRKELVTSLKNLRVKRFGDTVTIYRSACFFLRAEVDSDERSVTFNWRFDLWKHAKHSVYMEYRKREDLPEDDFHYERGYRKLPASGFRKDARIVRELAPGKTYDFWITVSVPECERSFVFEAHILSEDFLEHEAESAEDDQTLLHIYKTENDAEAEEIRRYIAEMNARTDLSEEERDAELQEWETILTHQRMKRMRRYFGIGDVQGG